MKINITELMEYINTLNFEDFCKDLFNIDYKRIEEGDGYYIYNFKMMQNNLGGFLNKCDDIRRKRISLLFH